jgi:hypothetical protein
MCESEIIYGLTFINNYFNFAPDALHIRFSYAALTLLTQCLNNKERDYFIARGKV